MATILIIDDHASVRMLLARVLEDAGYQVYEAANGRQGLEQFQAQPVDLVITDLEMPEMTGLDVILALTRVLFNVKVIAISGGSGDGLEKARLLGARQTFSKPLDLSALLHGIESELQHEQRPRGR
jgi:two-component system response regulator (stage 0 sporulation protein F)